MMVETLAPLHAIGGAHPSVWIAPALAVLGVGLVIRCIVRGHAVRDLRSLWLGLTLLALAVPFWLATRVGSRPPAAAQARTADQPRPLTGPTPAVQSIIERHCYSCHSSRTSLMRAAWTFHLDQPGTIDRLAPRIYRQVVQLRAMPAGNDATHMTEEERQVIARWYEARPKPSTQVGKPN